MAPRPVGELQQLLNNLVDLLLVHQVETFFNREQHPIVGRGWRLLTAVIMAQGRPRSRVALRRVPYSRVSQRTSVQARLEPDDQHPGGRLARHRVPLPPALFALALAAPPSLA